MHKQLLLFTIFAVSLPLISAQCPEPTLGKYPGWEDRTLGGMLLGVGNSTSVEDFNLTVTRIIGTSSIHVNIMKQSSEYVSTSVTVGKDFRLIKPDIMVELYNIVGNQANISVYTPQRANLTVNLTNIDIFEREPEKITLMPNEEFQIDISINNTGELQAKNIKITPQFGDFEIMYTDIRDISYQCQGSTSNFKYNLRTPDVRKVFNYTLYLKLEYSDENIQTGESHEYTEYYPIEIEIAPAVIEVERSTSNSTLLNPGRDVRVQVILNNTGNTTVYNVEWSDTPPADFVVTQGSNSWEGTILEGSAREFSYKIVSDDPILCQGVSTVKYEDVLGNSYTSFSNNETVRFSPFISIEKKIDGVSWYIDPTKNIMSGDTTWSIDSDKWWKNRTNESIIDNLGKVWVNRTANVTVKIKNRGNAVAKGLFINETLEGLEAEGTTSWRGDLKPDSEASYSYTAKVLRHGNITLSTNAIYLDVDLASFEPPIEVEEIGKYLRYCTKIIEETTFSSKDEFYGLHHNVTINQSKEMKALSDFEFDFNVTLLNNGSDSVHDVLILINTSGLKVVEFKYGGEIIEGQPFYYLPELRAQYYPDGTVRSWGKENVTYSLILWAPDVEKDTNFTLFSIVNYTDFDGNVHSKNATTNLTVVKAKPAYEIVTAEKKDLAVTPGVPKEIEVGDYGEAFLRLESKGYSALDNVTLKVSLPVGLEIASNDTTWKGRIEAELRQANDTWYVFAGDMTWNGSLGVREERKLPLLIRGAKAGLYNVPYTVKFDGEELSSSFDFKVKGAILTITKSLSDYEINVTEDINVTVTVQNIGEDIAKKVVIADRPPINFEVLGETTTSLEELKPDEEIVLSYILKAPKDGSYALDKATVRWKDRLGIEYMESSKELRLEVMKIEEEEIPIIEEEEVIKLTRKQLIATLIFTLIVLGLLLRMLMLTRPIKKK